MIPKIIHYCWFSKKNKTIPKKYQKFIINWKKILPDYKFILWTSDNFDINSSEWTKTAFKAEKYAFVSDFVRMYALYNYGGIYLDIDVEVVKKFDDFLLRDFILGFESDHSIATSTMGAQKEAPWVLDCLKYYNNKQFIANNNFDPELPNPCILYNVIKKNYSDYFNDILPYDYLTTKSLDGKWSITENTLTIHHFDSSWLDCEERILKKIKYFFWSKKLFRKLYAILLNKR